MKLYSQRDPRWAKHALGWGPALGTIGQYGCFVTCLAMIDAETVALAINPAGMDDILTLKKIFVRDSTGTYDLLPDRALDLAYPGRFQTVVYPGFSPTAINKALPSKYSYTILWISTLSVPTHFVIAYSRDAQTIADPWTGRAGFLSGYGGPSAVHKTLVVTYLPPAPLSPTPPVLAPPTPVEPPVDVPPPGVPPTPVVIADPQPIPCPTTPPTVAQTNQLTLLVQAFVIAIIRIFQGGK